MIFYCSLAHPSTIIRAETAGKVLKYSESGRIEDYKLWIDLIKTKKFKFANIGSVLLKYRKHNE